MKKFITALILLAVILIFGGIHTWKISTLTTKIDALNSEISAALQNEDWKTAVSLLQEVKQNWDKNRLWVSVTIPTTEIEELEISLKQSLEYAALEDSSGFVGEFIMFRHLLEHLPHHEGFDIGEIL